MQETCTCTFSKQVLLPCNACEVLLYTHDVALVHSAVLRKRNFAILGEWLPGVRYLEAKMHGGAPFGAKILLQLNTYVYTTCVRFKTVFVVESARYRRCR